MLMNSHFVRAILTGLTLGAAVILCSCAAPPDDARPAELVYRNITVLKGLPARELEPLMRSFNRALGVECAHCHTGNATAKPAFAIARNMLRMVQELNAGPLQKTSGVSCWTCHRGQVQPSRLPREILNERLDKWPEHWSKMEESLMLTMAVYSTSLGVECEHCHDLRDWRMSTKPAHQMVATMNAMFKIFPQYMPASARTQCWMCHKGSLTPAR